MTLGRGELRNLRLNLAQPIYPIDKQIQEIAKKSDPAGNKIYSLLIDNPASHQIYRYLAEFTVAVLEKHFCKPLSGMEILDWGGGKGYASYFLKKKAAKVVLYERDDFLHRTLWQKLKLNHVTSSEDSLPFPDKKFDSVIAFGVLEHVPHDYESLKELNRVLKDDGLLFIYNLPSKTSYVHKLASMKGVKYHDRLYTRKEITLLLKRTGFNTIGRPWFRQLLPKTHYSYPAPKLFERLDLAATNHTPLKYLASSIELVARKQYSYTTDH